MSRLDFALIEAFGLLLCLNAVVFLFRRRLSKYVRQPTEDISLREVPGDFEDKGKDAA